MFSECVHGFSSAARHSPFLVCNKIFRKINATLNGILKIQHHDVLRVRVIQKFSQRNLQTRLYSC